MTLSGFEPRSQGWPIPWAGRLLIEEIPEVLGGGSPIVCPEGFGNTTERRLPLRLGPESGRAVLALARDALLALPSSREDRT